MNRLIRLTDVTLRDGLQSYPHLVNTCKKLDIFQNIARTGVNGIEVGSVVSPKLKQMADIEKMLYNVSEYSKINRYTKKEYDVKVLVPSSKKLEELSKMNGYEVVNTISCITAATDAFTKKNMNMSLLDSLTNIDSMISQTRDKNYRIYISCCFGCPFTENNPVEMGKIANNTISIIQKYIENPRVTEIIISDTIGQFSNKQLENILSRVEADKLYKYKIGCHLHMDKNKIRDIIPNLVEIYGIYNYDISFGEIGGCPTVKQNGTQPINMDAVETIDILDSIVDRTNLYHTMDFGETFLANSIVKKVLQSTYKYIK